jgi:hypothetical protein
MDRLNDPQIWAGLRLTVLEILPGSAGRGYSSRGCAAA